MKLGMQVGLGPGHIVLDGDHHHHHNHLFSLSLCFCQHPQTCEWTSMLIQSQLMSLGQENFLNCGQCVRCTILFYKCKLMWRPLNLSTVIIFPCYTVVLRNQNVFFNDHTRS